MKVKNINGTSDNTCHCGSWMDHWKKFGGQSINYCPVENCLAKAEVGAHVQKEGSAENRWFIIPLCRKHNGETGQSLNIGDAWPLVSANVSETCGK